MAKLWCLLTHWSRIRTMEGALCSRCGRLWP